MQQSRHLHLELVSIVKFLSRGVGQARGFRPGRRDVTYAVRASARD